MQNAQKSSEVSMPSELLLVGFHEVKWPKSDGGSMPPELLFIHYMIS